MSSESVNQQSMLDHRQEKLRSINRKQLMHSMTIVLKLCHNLTDKKDIENNYKTLFSKTHTKYPGDSPSGPILIYPQHLITYIEAPLDVLNSMVIELAELESKKDMISAGRLLNFATNMEHRIFPKLFSRSLDFPSLPRGEIYQTNDPIEQTVGSCIEKIYKLATKVSNIAAPNEEKEFMDTFSRRAPELVIQQDVLEYLVCHDELLTLSEYIQRYCQPPFVTFESDFVWPLSVRLFPYN